MQLSPRYGVDPVIELDGPPADILEPNVRQRRRLVAGLAVLTDEQWSHPSRCAGWSNRDVIVHLDTATAFWSYSVVQGIRGTPTEFMATFDPVASPAEMVAADDISPAELLDRFAANSDRLTDALTSLDDDGWRTPAEAPPGHISITALAHHALWDSWVHERDVLVPLGLTPDIEADEVIGSLRYAAALGPALAMNDGATGRGVLAVSTTDPDVAFTVDIGDRVTVRSGSDDGTADLTLTGDAVQLLEVLSTRAPLDHEVPPESVWMLAGLLTAFDQAP